jgi:hypothetical protein
MKYNVEIVASIKHGSDFVLTLAAKGRIPGKAL